MCTCGCTEFYGNGRKLSGRSDVEGWSSRLGFGLTFVSECFDTLVGEVLVQRTAQVDDERLLLEEHATVLTDRTEQTIQRGPGASVGRMGVTHRVHVGPRCMDCSVESKTDRVHRTVAVRDLTAVVDLHETRHLDLPNGHADQIQPGSIVMLGVASREVSDQSFGEDQASGESTGSGQPFEAVGGVRAGVGEALKAGGAKRSPDLPPLQIMTGGTVALGNGPVFEQVKGWAE